MEFQEVVRRRKMVRSFQDRPLPDGALDRVLANAGEAPIGPPGGLYDNQLFTDERGTMVVYIPVTDPPASSTVEPFLIPAAEFH